MPAKKSNEQMAKAHLTRSKPTPTKSTVYDRVQLILTSALDYAARSVNTAQVVANWLVGREIVEEEQQGSKCAGYGDQVIAMLAQTLRTKGVTGYGEVTLSLCRQFFQTYPVLPGDEICYALRNESAEARPGTSILYAVRKESSLASDSTTSLVTSRYQLHLPSEDDLAAELRRELALLAPPKNPPAKRAPKRSAP